MMASLPAPLFGSVDLCIAGSPAEATFVCGHITAVVPAAAAQRSRLITDLCQQADENGEDNATVSMPLPEGVSMPDVKAWLACSSPVAASATTLPGTADDSETLVAALKVC